MKTLLAAVLSLCTVTLSASTAPATASPARSGSGIEGIVIHWSAGPNPGKPIARPAPRDRGPMSNVEIVVKDVNGKEVARTKTDKNGRYEFKLPAGKYTVVGPRNGIKPENWKKDVEVKANQWLNLNIHIASGIRVVAPVPAAKPARVNHKVDLAQLPAKLTVKVGDTIRFSGPNFVSWKVIGGNLLEQSLIDIFPPQLVVVKAGTGKLEIRYKDSKGRVQTHLIDLTVR
jgi:hypothetical protein